MGLSTYVRIVVTTANPGLTAQGFGIPLACGPASFVERTRTYNSISAVGDDFNVTDPVYMALNVLLSQKKSCPTVMVGREANVPTQKFSVGVQAVNVGTLYALRLAAASGGAWVSQEADYTAVGAVAWANTTAYVQGDLVTNDSGKLYTCITSGTSAGSGGPTGTAADITDGTVHWMYAGAGAAGDTSNDAIINGLQVAVAALAAPALAVTLSLQGSAGARTLQILANSAGAFFGLEVLNRAALNGAQTHADPGIAADLTAIKLESSEWYGLLTLFNSAALVEAAAAWVNSNGPVLYVADSLDTAIATHALSGATDVFATLKTSSYDHTHCVYHPANDEFLAAGEMGFFFPIDPGGDNWRLKTIIGPKVKSYTDTEETNIVAKFANYYSALGSSTGSTNVLQGDGKVCSGEYVDAIRFIDWYVANLQTNLINALIQNNKIAYTDLGVSTLENILRAMNNQGIAAGGIAASPAPEIIAQPVADQPVADRTARVYNGLSTSWTSAGAINSMTVDVAVSA